jgi:4-amino-4-deoxy-L-arabinose transferase-like glycosyltransferase
VDGSSARRVVALLTLAFVLLGTAFALLVPMFGNFDEQTHLDRARYTARHAFSDPGPDLRITYGSWAALDAVRDGQGQRGDYRAFRDYPGGDAGDPAPCPGVCQNIQYPHPPGWYQLVAPVTSVLEGQTFPRTVLAVRLLDILLVAPLVPLGWLTALEVWPGARRRALAVAAVVALAGPLAYSASAVNNDSLLFLACGVAIALAARLLRRGPSPLVALGLGTAITVGLLTKAQMVLVTPPLALAALLSLGPWRQRLRDAALVGAGAAPGVLWWLVQLQDEGPLTPESSELLAPARPGPWTHRGFPGYVVDHLPTLLGRIWGTFDAPVTFVQGPVRAVLGVGVLLVAVGWLVCREQRLPRIVDLRWLVLAAVPVALSLGVMWASLDAHRRTGEVRGLAPRYLHPAATLFAIAAVGALATVTRRLLPRVAPRALLVAGIPAFAAVAAIGTVARAVQGSYGTSSWRDILDRAAVIGPVGQPGVLLVVVVAAWLGALGLACRLVWTARD